MERVFVLSQNDAIILKHEALYVLVGIFSMAEDEELYKFIKEHE